MRMFVSLGSNVEPQRNLGLAIAALRRRFRVAGVSAAYRTVPVGDLDQPDFWNLAAELDSDEPPQEVQAALRDIEASLGRRRDPARPFGPRTVDLDLVLADGSCGNFEGLELPSPLVASQPFVAVPLAELAPDFVHPLLHTRLGFLARSLVADAQRPPQRLDVELEP